MPAIITTTSQEHPSKTAGDCANTVPTVTQQISVGIAIALVSGYIGHRFTKWRDAVNRRETAANEFRIAINTASANMPSSVVAWAALDSERLTDFLAGSRIAINNFSPHVGADHRIGFQRQWHELERHCKEEMPAAMSQAVRLYNNARSQKANQSFHNHVKKLLTFGNKQA